MLLWRFHRQHGVTQSCLRWCHALSPLQSWPILWRTVVPSSSWLPCLNKTGLLHRSFESTVTVPPGTVRDSTSLFNLQLLRCKNLASRDLSLENLHSWFIWCAACFVTVAFRAASPRPPTLQDQRLQSVTCMLLVIRKHQNTMHEVKQPVQNVLIRMKRGNNWRKCVWFKRYDVVKTTM